MTKLIIDLEKKAYKLQGRTDFQGLNISIENRKGSVRKGVDKDGHEWRTKMKHAYGYIRLSDEVRRKGADDDHIDCFIGPSRGSERVFVVHMNRADNGKFDEDKVFLCFDSKEDAKAAFMANYDKIGQKLFGGMTEMDMSVFKQRLAIQSKGMIKSLSFTGLSKSDYLQKYNTICSACGSEKPCRCASKFRISKADYLENLEEILAHSKAGPERDKIKAEYDRLKESIKKALDLDGMERSNCRRDVLCVLFV